MPFDMTPQTTPISPVDWLELLQQLLAKSGNQSEWRTCLWGQVQIAPAFRGRIEALKLTGWTQPYEPMTKVIARLCGVRTKTMGFLFGGIGKEEKARRITALIKRRRAAERRRIAAPRVHAEKEMADA